MWLWVWVWVWVWVVAKRYIKEGEYPYFDHAHRPRGCAPSSQFHLRCVSRDPGWNVTDTTATPTEDYDMTSRWYLMYNETNDPRLIPEHRKRGRKKPSFVDALGHVPSKGQSQELFTAVSVTSPLLY